MLSISLLVRVDLDINPVTLYLGSDRQASIVRNDPLSVWVLVLHNGRGDRVKL